MMRSGTWWMYSKTDPRWCVSAHSDAVGMFQRPPALDAKIVELTRLHGDPPADLEWGYMKD